MTGIKPASDRAIEALTDEQMVRVKRLADPVGKKRGRPVCGTSC